MTPVSAKFSLSDAKETVPILLLLGAVQVSVFLPGNLARPVWFWISTGLLLTLPPLFAKTYPRSILAPALIYTASACALVIAAGVNSGVGLMLFLPVVGVAVLGSRIQCVLVIAAVFVGSIAISLMSDLSIASTVRRAVLYVGISVVISMAIIRLRESLIRSRERAKLLLKDAQAVNDMARSLAQLTEPASITRTAAELAAAVGSPPGSSWRRGAFLGIDGGHITVDSQFDQFDDLEVPGAATDVDWPSPDDPLILRAVETGSVTSGSLVSAGAPDVHGAGPRDEGIFATWVPIAPDARIQGLLGVATRGMPMPRTSVDQLVSLGHLVELALSNWSAHKELEETTTREERRRIARELHDGLAQELAFIASKTKPTTPSQNSLETFRQLADAADRALDEARRAIVVLSEVPEELNDAITQTVEDLAARHGVTARLNLSGGIVLAGEAKENLLRIIREAITNASRHGHASTVTLRLVRDGDVLNLVVADDGQGFDVESRDTVSGFGLTFMEERCSLIGGSLKVSSGPGTGTRVEVRLPA